MSKHFDSARNIQDKLPPGRSTTEYTHEVHEAQAKWIGHDRETYGIEHTEFRSLPSKFKHKQEASFSSTKKKTSQRGDAL
jgi:hypothetical protein